VLPCLSSLDLEPLQVERLYNSYLDVKKKVVKNHNMAKAEVKRDHIDRFLEEHADALGTVDIAVEAIVDRINGIARRLRHAMDETLAQFDLSWGEWSLLTNLRWSGPPHRKSPGDLARKLELSSGAMTNRLDRLERAGLVARLPDPDDRRGLLVELTDHGLGVWQESVVAQSEKEAIIAAALSSDEMEELNQLLRRVMIELERREGKADC
jgi:DNA-binding MarR family transcriptional regulator